MPKRVKESDQLQNEPLHNEARWLVVPIQYMYDTITYNTQLGGAGNQNTCYI